MRNPRVDERQRPIPVEQRPGALSIKLLRPQDLLSLELRFKNFKLDGGKLIRIADPGLMMVLFQPQSIAETCGVEELNTLTPPPFPVKLLISGKSRLVFKVKRPQIELNANDLLNWDDMELVVNSRAKGPEHPPIIFSPFITKRKFDFQLQSLRDISTTQASNIKGLTKDERINFKQRLFPPDLSHAGPIVVNPHPLPIADPVAPPDEWETSLEVPFRLFISPTKIAGWIHTKKLQPSTGVIKEEDRVFELWHTRLGTKTNHGIDETDLTAADRVLRVLWGEKIDKEFKNVPLPADDPYLGNTSTNDNDRHQIVHQSSNFSIPNFTPQPVIAHKLFLTTLGSYLDSIFVIDRAKQEKIPKNLFGRSFDLLKWRQIQTLAREHYVELVHAGNIMPFGHEAVLITITERKPHKGTTTAPNFKREIVVITEHEKDYNYRDSNGNFMKFCFSRVKILNPTSPLLDKDKKKLVDPSPMVANDQFVIRSGGADVLFKMHTEDLNGNIVNFQMPLIFVSRAVTSNPTFANDLITAYNKGFLASNTNFNGQKLSLAPLETNGCDTAFAAFDASFSVQKYFRSDELQGFLPNLVQTKIIEPSYQRLTGKADKVFVSLENDDNAGHVFAKFNFSQPVNFTGNADKTGGFAMPNFNLSGLSKAAGAFGGNIDKFKSAAADAKDYFSVTSLPDPVLFGVFKLSDILNFQTGDVNSYDLSKPLLDRVPKIPNLTTEETDTEIITSYVIKPLLQNWGIDGVVNFIVDPSPSPDSFSIVTQTIINKKDPLASPKFSTEAAMKAFTIALMGNLINIKFLGVSFTASPGKSADVNIQMDNPALVFGGPLSFINAFQKLIPPGGFSDPPYLDVSLTGVKCGYTLALPNLQLGVFSLSNLSLGAEVNLPFTGAPLVMGFRFCEKQQPFALTVSLLGGGGYFGFEADLHGLRQIDAALEFGAAVSLNLGVASGSVSIMAGIYFKMTLTSGENSTELTGYVRINGAMSILGLITASIELYMALTYLIDQQKAYGEATVTIKVHVLFFSKSVSVHTSRTFAGSGSDPNFAMTYTEPKWIEYCEAFAA